MPYHHGNHFKSLDSGLMSWHATYACQIAGQYLLSAYSVPDAAPRILTVSETPFLLPGLQQRATQGTLFLPVSTGK